MKKSLLYLLMMTSLLLGYGCKEDDDDNDPDPVDPNAWTIKSEQRNNPSTGNPETIYNVSGTLTGAATFEASKKYKLNGYVRVENGGVLTIEPGTIIVGDFATKGTLIIQRGGKILAQGTATQPIVFTSDAKKGSRSTGNWGGIVICGRAQNNIGPDAELEGGYGGVHGGTDNADNSGVLSYVRIEFGGVALLPNQEINGLTMGSVGSGTQIDHVQVSYNGDDAFEWFGGTVNCSHLVSLGNVDDDLDIDNGYTGNIQYAVILRNPVNADQSGSNGLEIDNDGNGSDATPLTAPKIANVTFVGPQETNTTLFDPNFSRAAHLRRNSRAQVYNSALFGNLRGIDIDGEKSQQAANDGILRLEGVVLGCLDASKDLSTSNAPTNPVLDIATWFATGAFNNFLTNDNADLELSTYPKVPSSGANGADLPSGLIPDAGTTLANTSANALPAGMVSTNFAGAFAPGIASTTAWTAGWTNWNPNNTDY